MTIKTKYVFHLALMALTLLSCSNAKKKNELNFLWQPSTGASPFYPSRIVFGSLSAGDKYIDNNHQIERVVQQTLYFYLSFTLYFKLIHS